MAAGAVGFPVDEVDLDDPPELLETINYRPAPHRQGGGATIKILMADRCAPVSKGSRSYRLAERAGRAFASEWALTSQ
jgi:hypothetical protein